jgi:hypothetical protein
MVEDLEIRLNRVSDESVQRVLTAFREPHINPRDIFRKLPYMKKNWTDKIAEKIGSPEEFSDTLYTSVNKDVLKRVYYGILSTGNVPQEYLDALTNWERIYLFRGRWSERDPNLDEPLTVMTSRHLYFGVNKLHQDHYVRKAEGEYDSDKKFPESDRIREDYKRIVLGVNLNQDNAQEDQEDDDPQMYLFR